MPSVELFMKEFLNEEDLKIAHKLLLNGSVQQNLWGLDYTEINNKIKNRKNCTLFIFIFIFKPFM